MERALEIMRNEVREKHSVTLSNLVQQTNSPFTHQILEYITSLKYRAPPIEDFDESGDPIDHLEIFKGHMAYQGVGDTLMCQAFSLTLRKSAQKWFGQLFSNSIHNFKKELSKAFVSHFLAGCLTRKSSAHLWLYAKTMVKVSVTFWHDLIKKLWTLTASTTSQRSWLW